MDKSRFANTSYMSNRNQTTYTGTNDRMVKLSEKLNKISVSFYNLTLNSPLLKTTKFQDTINTRTK